MQASVGLMKGFPRGQGVAVAVSPMTPGDHAGVRFLVEAYAKEFADALGPQDFATETRELAKRYALPEARMLVARWEGILVGCVGWKRLAGPGAECEMKRMVVAPEARGMGVGHILAVAVMRDAAAHGFGAMYLDTVPEMDAARRLYARLGFEECPPYWETPLRSPIFMRRSLRDLPPMPEGRGPWPGPGSRRPARPRDP